MNKHRYSFLLGLAITSATLWALVAAPAIARPAASARITALSAQTGGQTVHVELKVKCATGWDNNVFDQRLVVREDTSTATIIAFTNFHGADVGWACDDLDHTLTFDLVPDAPWQAGSLRASFDLTVTDGTGALAGDFPAKKINLR